MISRFAYVLTGVVINWLTCSAHCVNDSQDIQLNFIDNIGQKIDIDYDQMINNAYRNKIKNIFIKNTAGFIEYRAFYGCQNLTFVDFEKDSHVKEIGFMAFAECENLRTIKIPDSVEYIGMNAFQGCSQLESVVLSKNLKIIKDDVFSRCGNLRVLVVPDTAKISCCENSQLANYIDIILILNGRAAKIGTFKKGQLNIYKMSDFSRNMLNQNMEECAISETKIVLPEGVEKVYLRDFWLNMSRNLKEIVLPKSLEIVEKRTFEDYQSLETVIFMDGNKLIELQERCFANCQNLRYMKLPNNLTKISGHMFFGCRQLQAINIPKNLRHVEPEAFCGCDNLVAVTVPDSIELYAIHDKPETISIFCFNKNNGVFFKFKQFKRDQIDTKNVKLLSSGGKEFILPDGVKEIADYTFEGQDFNCIKLPNSLKRIGKLAFSGCKKLTKIAIPDSVQIIENEAFYGCENLTYMKLSVKCGKYILSRGNLIGTTKISLLKADGDICHIGDFVDDKLLIEQSRIVVPAGKKNWHI